MKFPYNRIVILLILVLSIACTKSSMDKDKYGVLFKSISQNRDVKGLWIGFYSTSFSPKGKKILSDPITGLDILEFKDTSFTRKITRDDNSTGYYESGIYKVKEDTITLISSKRRSIYYTFKIDQKILELEDSHSPIMGYSKTLLKPITLYKPSFRLEQIREFLTSSSIQIKELTCSNKKECQCIKRYEFYNNYLRDESYDCFEINWYTDTWQIDSTQYSGELFLKMSNFNSPIQIKEVRNDTIKGVRYGLIDTEVIISKTSQLFNLETLIGKWKVVSYLGKEAVKEIEITENAFIEIDESGTRVQYYWSNSVSNEFLYIDKDAKKANRNKGYQSFLVARLSQVNKNYLKIAIQERSKKQWFHLELKK